MPCFRTLRNKFVHQWCDQLFAFLFNSGRNCDAHVNVRKCPSDAVYIILGIILWYQHNTTTSIGMPNFGTHSLIVVTGPVWAHHPIITPSNHLHIWNTLFVTCETLNFAGILCNLHHLSWGVGKGTMILYGASNGAFQVNLAKLVLFLYQNLACYLCSIPLI